MGLLSTIKSIFGLSNKNDRHLVCQDCKRKFVFDAGEQEFFKSKGFSDPKRCPRCRKKAKTKMGRKGQGRGRKGNGFRHRSRNRRHSIIDGDSPYADE